MGCNIFIQGLVVSDLELVLQLNQAEAHIVKDLTPERQAWVSNEQCLCLGAYVNGEFAGFSMALPPSVEYGSPNYRWFGDRYDSFLYIDRVVVAKTFRGIGVAKNLVEETIIRARRSGVRMVCSEFDKKPLNQESCALHQSKSFKEVGLRVSSDGASVISMQSLELTS